MQPPWLTKSTFVRIKDEFGIIEGRWKYIAPLSTEKTQAIVRLSNTSRVIHVDWEDILPEFTCAECEGPRDKNDYICQGCRS
jgi:hypothetical protein